MLRMDFENKLSLFALTFEHKNDIVHNLMYVIAKSILILYTSHNLSLKKTLYNVFAFHRDRWMDGCQNFCRNGVFI